MRMADIVVPAGVVRFLRNHAEFLAVAEAGPVPDDFEGTEIDFIQNDALGYHGNRGFGSIHMDILEFGHQRQDIAVDVPDGRAGFIRTPLHIDQKPLEIVGEPLPARGQRLPDGTGRCPPAPVLSPFMLALQAQQVGLVLQRQAGHSGRLTVLVQGRDDAFGTVP